MVSAAGQPGGEAGTREVWKRRQHPDLKEVNMNHSLSMIGLSKTTLRSMNRSFAAAILRGFAIAMFCGLAASVALANSEARSFCNDTGVPANDWHVMVRGGAANLNYVTSNGLAPSFSPMPTSNATAGGGPYNGGTLSGGNVPIGGCVSVTYGYNALTPGHLDWYWTNNGNQIGVLHRDGQQWYFSVSNVHNGFGNVTVTVANTSNQDAQYNNFEAGTSASDPTFGPFSFDPGQIPSPSDIDTGPTNFTVPAGGFQVFSFFDVFVDLHLDAYGDVNLPNDSFYQLTSQTTPEPSTLLLLGSGLVGIGGLLRTRMPS
jgi:hypothetical protein